LLIADLEIVECSSVECRLEEVSASRSSIQCRLAGFEAGFRGQIHIRPIDQPSTVNRQPSTVNRQSSIVNKQSTLINRHSSDRQSSIPQSTISDPQSSILNLQWIYRPTASLLARLAGSPATRIRRWAASTGYGTRRSTSEAESES
jgi:hypothetical protein